MESTLEQRRRPRWRKWVLLGLALLALRLALPAVVAPLVAARLSRALGARVEIGDLAFQPLDAIVTLRSVTVHAPAPPGAPANPTPPIVADRVRIDVQWLPLLHRTLQVRELVLESAHVDLDRFPDGGFGLANLERADPATELPAGWSFALDSIGLRDSRLRVRDLAAGDGAFVEVTLRHAGISGWRRRATAFGKAPNLHVDAVVGGGQLRVDGRYEWRDDGLVLDAVVRVKAVPLAHAQSYVATLGWTDLSGQVSGQLRWQREPRRRDLLSGQLVLRRGSVRVAGLTEPALAVRRAIADIKAIDLLRRRIAIGSLTLRGATLLLRPDAGAPIPLLTATRAHPPPPRGTRPDAAARWSWMIERFDTANSHVRVLVPGGQFALRAHAAGENFGRGAYWSPLRIEVARHEIAAAFDGTARIADGLTIEGHLTAGGIDFPGVARAAGLPWADCVQAGQATADLTVQLDTAGDAPPLYTRGTIGLTDLWFAGPDPGTFAFGAAGVALTLEDLAVRQPGRAGSRDGRRTRISLSQVDVSAPVVLLTRTTDGWIVPPLAPTTEPPSDETPEIVLAKVRSSGGALVVIDQVPDPAIIWEVTRVDGSVQNLLLPPVTFDDLRVRGSHSLFGDLQLGGSRHAGTNQFEVSADGASLAALTPYLRLAGLPYHFASGRGSFTARGSIGEARWMADVALTLQAPELIGADASLQLAVGMPISSALARLRDQNGDVGVQVMLASPPADGRDSYADQVAVGVRESIERGAVAARAAAAERAAAFPAVTVLFQPGQAEPAMLAMQQLDPLIALLGTHRSLVVVLTSETSEADRRWFAEQALSETLDDNGRFMGLLRALGMRADRDRIRSALAARARGAPGVLDRNDEALLTRLLAEAPPVDDGQLAALREARLMSLVRYLTDHQGVTGGRIVIRTGAPREGAPPPAVRAQITIGADPAADLPVPPPGAAGASGSPVPASEGLD